ncbi:hypothetical protein BRADI_5g03715v3 [Brachypodium distachyon]|uniref:DUF7597 domain-containing protein n=1 Tax=Brachypodium distachyon TaxID=15368 RepID=A0A0Q3I780_BRADI|nr:hypothetical protein BRADI_5g03715v3 [Brachypodium distachyon]
MAVHASITLGLDFAPGVAFRKEVKRIHGVLVHPEGKSKHFYLAVSFRLALECCLGGLCDGFSVVHLRDQVFRFSVSTKSVGFMIYNLHKFSCAQFKCFFHLWGNGGPRWNSEFKSWQRENQEEWTLILPSDRYVNRALNAMNSVASPVLKSASRALLWIHANFDLDPAPYVPRGMAIEDGGPFCLQRTFVTLAGALARRHESYLIAMVEPPLPTEEVPAVIAQVHAYMVEILHYEVVSLHRHPSGLARFRMCNAIDRDMLVSLLAVDFGPGRTLRFVKHDEANNSLTTEFTRNGWVMLLGIPLDLQDDAFIMQAVETFGKLEYWIQRESTDVRVIAKVIYEDATTVPRDIVVREVMVVGGRTVSWTIPVYILNSGFADEFPPPEDQLPSHGGNQHLLPGHGPVQQ